MPALLRPLLKGGAAIAAPPCSRAIQTWPVPWSGPSPDVKFDIYHGGALHPTYGDEARQRVSEARWEDCHSEPNPRNGIGMEHRPGTAVVALRHPRFGGGGLEDLRRAYSSKLRVGGPAVLVQDGCSIFARATVAKERGESMLLVGQELMESGASGLPVCEAPLQDVYAGWPAHANFLSYPVRLLAQDIEFMWPDTVFDEVEIKRSGVPLDPESGLGSMLRNPRDLEVCIDGVDYPLCLDPTADRMGRKATKAASRRVLVTIFKAQIFGTLFLLACWVELEIRMSRDEIARRALEERRAGHLTATLQRDRVTPPPLLPEAERSKEWGDVQLGCDFNALATDWWSDTHADSSGADD